MNSKLAHRSIRLVLTCIALVFVSTSFGCGDDKKSGGTPTAPVVTDPPDPPESGLADYE